MWIRKYRNHGVYMNFLIRSLMPISSNINHQKFLADSYCKAVTLWIFKVIFTFHRYKMGAFKLFIASCTDLLQIILKHFNRTQWVYDKYFDAIYISVETFLLLMISRIKDQSTLLIIAQKRQSVYIYKIFYRNYDILHANVYC